MGMLSYSGNNFYLDGEQYTVLSGAVHYFRIVPAYWEDTLKKLKFCGFNTVETYTCWNLHERKEGEFDFQGILDVERFIDIADSLGLNVILRPGPYICAEWEFGGLPSWLLAYPDLRIRSCNEVYLSKVRNYFKELFRRLNPRLAVNGGNIIMVQIENEYGSYGHDEDYLRAIIDIYRELNVDSMLFTSDGNEYSMLTGGTLPDCFAAVNFGDHVKDNFDAIIERDREHPLFCAEFWNGWFDHWGEKHATGSDTIVAGILDQILDAGASVNVYMFQGGTNFGFMNGANFDGKYRPTITSYDYCAPLSESGDLTEKYFLMKKVMEKHFGKAQEVEFAPIPKIAYGKVRLSESASLFDNLDILSKPVYSPVPLSMEEVGQDFGFILYTSYFEGPLQKGKLIIHGLRDRALIFVNGEFMGIKERDGRDDDIRVEADFGEKVRVDILVENMGRINFGPYMQYEKKGIIGHVEMDYGDTQQMRFKWNIYPLPLENLSDLTFISESDNGTGCPLFLRGYFDVADIGDCFLKLDGFTKGVAFLNGFNLGRYWPAAGPQQTLYVPSPLLKPQGNELVIFELEHYAEPIIELVDKPELDMLNVANKNIG